MSVKHLFKLKKDGKTVGYLKIEYGHIYYRYPIPHRITIVYWICNKIEFETAHPFVTKDKDGKDVFAGDFCRIGDPFGGIGSTVEGYVRWTDAELTWRIEWNDRRGDTISMLVSAITDIELIEAPEKNG